MSNITAIFLAILTLLGLIMGRRISVERKGVLNLSSFLCLSLILLNLFLRFNNSFEYQYLDYEFYSHIRQWWVFPFAIYLFALGERVAKNSIARLGALFLMALLLFVVTISIYLTFFNDYQYLGQPDKNGFCAQTTGISCGPAAAATFLSLQGCISTEKEMAELCNTNPISGSSEFDILRAIRFKFPNRADKFKLKTLNFDQLALCKMPLLTVVKINRLTGHWIVVTEVKADKIRFFDPLSKEKEISRSEFLKNWQYASIY